ncbi:unnamed protein product [Tenebrio molitor]|nr:unnamed protein product [Tenebrio molitor]
MFFFFCCDMFASSSKTTARSSSRGNPDVFTLTVRIREVRETLNTEIECPCPVNRESA